MSYTDAKPHYFIRNDDVGELTDTLKRFVAAFIDHGLPVSYQIIPEQLTPECARWCVAQAEKYPALVSFGQHGLRHSMTVGGRLVWREFGPERSLSEQSAIISEGRAILQNLLGSDQPVPVFTPPQHKYDRNTLIAAQASEFSVFSAASYADLPHRAAYAIGRTLGWSSIRHHGISRHGKVRDDVPLFDLSISVAIDNAARLVCQPDDIAAAASAAAHHTDMIGFMFHHSLYEKDNESIDLYRIVEALSELGRDRFRNMTELSALTAHRP